MYNAISWAQKHRPTQLQPRHEYRIYLGSIKLFVVFLLKYPTLNSIGVYFSFLGVVLPL